MSDKSNMEAFIRFHEAVLDFFYEVVKAFGVIKMFKRFNWGVKEWVRIRIEKENDNEL